MLKTNELELKQVAEAARDAENSLGPEWLTMRGMCSPETILALLAELDSARFAARQHLQTVENQARIIAGGAPVPATHRLLPVVLLPAIEDALRRHTPLPQTAWVEIVQAYDRTAQAAPSPAQKFQVKCPWGTFGADGKWTPNRDLDITAEQQYKENFENGFFNPDLRPRVDAALERGTRIADARIPL